MKFVPLSLPFIEICHQKVQTVKILWLIDLNYRTLLTIIANVSRTHVSLNVSLFSFSLSLSLCFRLLSSPPLFSLALWKRFVSRFLVWFFISTCTAASSLPITSTPFPRRISTLQSPGEKAVTLLAARGTRTPCVSKIPRNREEKKYTVDQLGLAE